MIDTSRANSARVWNYWLGGKDNYPIDHEFGEQVRAFLPTTNTHHIAQSIAPTCRIVYVDHDPLVLAHARALLTSTPQGRIDYLNADLREPDTILQHAARTLDFTRPVALLLLEILNHITEDGQAHAIVSRLLDALPAGSYLTPVPSHR